jgi:benzodiazapine receptor
MNNWYDNLNKSSLTPPAWVFGPIWGILYTLMTLSLILYLNSSYTIKGLILFGIQLIINLFWPKLFFEQRQICGSLINVIIMNIFVFLTYLEFKKTSVIAANLLLPYIAWIILAAYLNFYICINN